MKASERHKLKHDKYAEGVVSALNWAQVHRFTISGILISALVITAAVMWITWSHNQANIAAADVLEGLENDSARVLDTEKDKRKETVDTIVKNYETLAKTYPETAPAMQGLVEAGDLLSREGRYSEAATFYTGALQKIKPEWKGLINLARRGLATALEGDKKYKEAIDQYQFFTADAGSREAAQACWDIGRCYEMLGETDQARASYEKAIEYGEGSDWATLARSRLNAKAEGVTVEAPTAPVVPPAPATDTGLVAPQKTEEAPAAPPSDATAAPAATEEKAAPESTTAPAAPANQETEPDKATPATPDDKMKPAE